MSVKTVEANLARIYRRYLQTRTATRLLPCERRIQRRGARGIRVSADAGKNTFWRPSCQRTT